MLMSNQTKKIVALPTTKPNHFVAVSVFYSKGRGYLLNIQPVEIEDHGLYQSEKYALFSGKSFYAEMAPRFNRRTLEAIAARYESLPEYKDALQAVLAKEGITLATSAQLQPAAQDAVLA